MLRALRPLLVPLLFGLALVVIAFVTRSGSFGWKNPGQPINSAMRQALGQMMLPPEDAERIAIRFPQAETTTSGLRFIVDRAGTGTQKPERGQIATVQFRESLLDGTVIEDTYARGEGPLNFPVGLGRVPAGWDEAVMSMVPGEKRTVIIPYWLGYGEKGQRTRVPAKATVIFEVELLSVQRES